MRRILVLALVLALGSGSGPLLASDSNWTEVSVTMFDQIDGEFSPTMSGAVVNYMNGKGIGAYLGLDNEIGLLTKWRVWSRSWGPKTSWAIFTVASTDVSDAAQTGVFNNGTFGLEPRFYWKEFGNAEIGIGALSTTFVKGEAAKWTPYVVVCFRP